MQSEIDDIRTAVSAISRIYAKGLLTQADGGYLTSLGREAAQHAQTALAFLTAGIAATINQGQTD